MITGWVNQDEHLVMPLAENIMMAAAFDGHGVMGHFLSSFAKNVFEQYAKDLIDNQGLEASDALTCLFRLAHTALEDERDLAWLSGTTAAVAIVDANRGTATVAHVGDSRVLLLQGSEVAFQTEDHCITAE